MFRKTNPVPALLSFLAAMLLMTFAGVHAQISAPQGTDFEVKEFSWENTLGDLADQVVLNNDRPDTLPEMGIRVRPANTDSEAVILDVTTWRRGYPNYTEKDTVPLWAECPLPRKGGGTGKVPDSLFYFYFQNQSLTGNEDMRAEIKPASEDASYLQMISFACDTLKGTAVDTSAAIRLGNGVKKAVFGFTADYATPEITYEVLYNLGHGWGLANPSDTLAGKTWTDDAPSGSWRFGDAGELLNGIICRIIRHGEAAADTGVVQQSLRLYPR